MKTQIYATPAVKGLKGFQALTLTTLNYFLDLSNMETKGFFKFESILYVLDSCFIWISMLWVYGHYKYFNFSSVGADFIRHNLASTNFWLWRIKTAPAQKGLNHFSPFLFTSLERVVSY